MFADAFFDPPLGFGEARMHAMHSRLGGTTQTAAAVRVAGPLTPTAFDRAVAEVQARHELLNVDIVEHEHGWYFARRRAPRALAVRYEVKQADLQWREVLETENNRPLDASSLVRFVVLLDGATTSGVHDIVVIAHHSVIDGIGAEQLYKALFEELAGIPRMLEHHPVPPNAELHLPRTLTWDDYGRLQREQAQKRPSFEPMPHLSVAALSERRTCIRTLELAEPQMERIDEVCLQNGVSFNAYVSTCLLMAAKRCSPHRSRFALNTAFSLRRLCGDEIGESELGCYLAVVPTYHELADHPNVHRLAKDYQLSLTRAVLEQSRLPRDVNYVALSAATAELANHRSFVHDLGYTYTESAIPHEYGQLRVLHVYQTANRTLGTTAVVVHGMRMRERAFFTFNHTRPLQDEAWVADVSKHFAQLLNDLVADEDAVPQ